MQVNVKCEYTELYLPTPRCRKYRSRDAKKSCETEVKEVKASELVPAFTVDEYVCPIYEKGTFTLSMAHYGSLTGILSIMPGKVGMTSHLAMKITLHIF